MTIALVEDDEAVLHSLQLLLEGCGMDVRCFTSAEAFLADPEARRSTCVISDVRLPGQSGLDLQAAMTKQSISAPLILITGHGDIAMAVAAMRAGASDFLEKPYDADQLIASIERALTTDRRERALEEEKAAFNERIAELSPRQRQVMDLVALGRSNKQIAAELGISPRTVENYRAWVMERMGAGSVAELVRKVLISQG